MTARPRRASTAAIVVFPAPDMPLICTASIGVYRRPALKAEANEFMSTGTVQNSKDFFELRCHASEFSSVVFRNMSLELAQALPPGDGDSMVEEPELTDARAMRALAHPVRLSLIDMLGYHESPTATQASDLIGESPTNCAFHLRTLAKYGFLREAATDSRRERPWTLVHRGVRISQHQDDPQAALAARALARTMLDRWLDRARNCSARPARSPVGTRRQAGR